MNGSHVKPESGRDDADEGPWALGGPNETARLGDTVRDRVARELRDRILTGRLEAGARLDLDEVGRELGTSRTPVREACLALMNEGLLKMAPRSGVTVLGLSAEDVLDNFELMARLSGFATERAAQRMTGDELAVAEAAQAEMVRTAREGGRVAGPNWRFHREIHRACRSKRLVSLIAQVGRTIPRTFFQVFPEHIPCALSEHDEIVDALRQRDGDRARRATERHFTIPAELVSQLMESPVKT